MKRRSRSSSRHTAGEAKRQYREHGVGKTVRWARMEQKRIELRTQWRERKENQNRMARWKRTWGACVASEAPTNNVYASFAQTRQTCGETFSSTVWGAVNLGGGWSTALDGSEQCSAGGPDITRKDAREDVRGEARVCVWERARVKRYGSDFEKK